MKHITTSSLQVPAGLAGGSWGGCTQAHAGKRPGPHPPRTSAWRASARRRRAAAHLWLTPAWHTAGSCRLGRRRCHRAGSCLQVPEGAGAPVGLPAGDCSGSSSWRWAAGPHLGRREDRAVGRGEGAHPSLSATPPHWSIPGGRKNIPPFPAPALRNPLSRERKLTTLCVAEKQSVHLRNSKLGLCTAFFLCRLLKSRVINGKAEPFCVPSPPQMLQRNIQSSPGVLLNGKAAPAHQRGKLCIGGESGLSAPNPPWKHSTAAKCLPSPTHGRAQTRQIILCKAFVTQTCLITPCVQ